MPVAYEVAHALGVRLDVFVVRKLGVPGHEELAMGAIASGGVRVTNERVVRAIELAQDAVDAVVAREQEEVDRRERGYRDGGEPAPWKGPRRSWSMTALPPGPRCARPWRRSERDAARIVVAVAIAPPDTCSEREREADAVVCARTPEPFHAVGAWYEEFEQTTDYEVRRLLADAPVGGRARAG